MKRRFFLYILTFCLFLFTLNLKGDVSWTRDPLITAWPHTLIKYVDIISGESSWHYGSVARVWVSAELSGVGEGVATLKNVYLMGAGELQIYGGEPTHFGTRRDDGSWESGTGSISVYRPVDIPDDAEDGDSWRWGAGGGSKITPTPWVWRESSSQG